MEIYLVGGAVRDQLLGLVPREKDWLVVGAHVEQMLQQGYKQVGKDFPVFLHPVTGEEYALARTERKTGTGYYGFAVHADEHVSLEADLLRRDLTINAMAMDSNGRIIDPYGGRADLKAKLLRHVSPAFVEDPLRVLRIARFAARFYHLGFRLASETQRLLYRMVRSGELRSLVPERVWKEWQRSFLEANPEQFILTLRQCGALAVVLPALDRLFGVPSSPRYHPEIDSGIHSLMALQVACRLSDDPLVRFAAVVHDLGKGVTPMHLWPRHAEHDLAGIPVITSLCANLRIPASYRDVALLVCEHHLTVHRYPDMDADARVCFLEKTDAFRRETRFQQLLITCEADARGVAQEVDYRQAQQWRYLLAECVKISSKTLVAQGFRGLSLKDELHRRRVACAQLIETMRNKNEK
ncbi:MAG: multifunctional CCA addition/repair protein [Legionellaceae bacterium]|nr:multifunctional CCA addition/repair protein [Legionellaceae bacterium]